MDESSRVALRVVALSVSQTRVDALTPRYANLGAPREK